MIDMERLTVRNKAGTACVSRKIEENENGGFMLVDRLAAYEDTGLEPEEVTELNNRLDENAGASKMWSKRYYELAADKLDVTFRHLRDLIKAEQEGRLVVLPCKASDKLYVVGGKRIILCDICETYLDDKNGPEYLVSFYCDSDCDGCPFNSWKQDYSGEWSCDGEYGQSVVVGADIGKTVFLTREEAEAALAGNATPQPVTQEAPKWKQLVLRTFLGGMDT